MLFCQVWIDRRATRSNLAKPQTFPLENPRGSESGLRFSLVFSMSLYKDYDSTTSNLLINEALTFLRFSQLTSRSFTVLFNIEISS